MCRNGLYTAGLVTGFDDNVRSNVQLYNTMFIRIVQVCSPATACIGQPLLTFCSHPEQSWIFAVIIGLIVAVLKITCTVLFCISIAYDQFESDYTAEMNIRLDLDWTGSGL